MFTKYLSFIVLGYLSGSIMFSYLIVKILKHIDLIDVSDDHNPGMANAFKYGGTTCGVLALVCDFFKAMCASDRFAFPLKGILIIGY